ncbi:MAG: hypothetical protein BWY83_01667 [bacterium ADurb.Bin478]|nr:MAG: hypothetical protein BWY83_01667 [bacterium ADurb.Bin478]
MLGGHRRIYHIAATAIVFKDSACDVARVGDKTVDTDAAGYIPHTQIIGKQRHQPFFHCVHFFRRKVLGVLVPDIAHGRVAIAEVKRIGPRNDSFGHAMAGGEDQIVGAQVKPLHRCGKQRKITAVAGFDAGQLLYERGDDGPAFDRRGDRSRKVHQGVNIRIGHKTAQGFENLFSPSHAGQPIMNQCDGHRVHPFI